MGFVNYKKEDVNETELVQGLKNKDIISFDILYDRYAYALYEIIVKLLTDRFIASKILEDSFVEAWKRIDSWNNSRTTIFIWLVRIAIEQCNREVHQPKDVILEKLGLKKADKPVTTILTR